LATINEFPELLKRYPNLKGLNVTIPFKEKIIPFLDELSPEAAAARAVNCIRIKKGRLMGHNTDVLGFESSLGKYLPKSFHANTLILGTGGAAKAVATVLKKKKIGFQFVSRQKSPDILPYEFIDKKVMNSHLLLINTTPLGMWPKTEVAPPIPYTLLSHDHFLFDLIYNPEETLFLKKGKLQGASIKNGLEMLLEQAEASWRFWNEN
jgi:shikimate dehydrogenase